MSTQIIDNFKVNVAKPIDSRMVTSGTQSRDNLQFKYDGLRVYDINQNAPFVWISGAWQQESGSGSGGSISSGTTYRLLKYTGSSTIGDSAIVDKGSFGTPNIGIGKIPSSNYALDINGKMRVLTSVEATLFIGELNGSNISVKSLGIDKITPGGNNQVLKTTGSGISATVNWVADLNTNIEVHNSTTDATVNYLLFTNTIAESNSVFINNNTTKLIGVMPSTSQILGSSDATFNDWTKPAYSFFGTTNAGLYGNSNEVGLSLGGVSKVKINLTTTNITNSLIVAGGSTFSSTLAINGATTLDGALTVAGVTTLNGNTSITGTKTLTVGTGSTTLGGTLAVSDTTTLNGNTSVTGTKTFTVGTGASTLGGALTVAGVTTLNGNTSITGTKTLTVGTGASTLGGTLTVAGVTTLNGNTSVSSSKTVTLTGTIIKAMYSTNEFNFINDNSYNSNVYFNYRGASNITSYKFWNGKGSGSGAGLTNLEANRLLLSGIDNPSGNLSIVTTTGLNLTRNEDSILSGVIRNFNNVYWGRVDCTWTKVGGVVTIHGNWQATYSNSGFWIPIQAASGYSISDLYGVASPANGVSHIMIQDGANAVKPYRDGNTTPNGRWQFTISFLIS